MWDWEESDIGMEKEELDRVVKTGKSYRRIYKEDSFSRFFVSN